MHWIAAASGRKRSSQLHKMYQSRCTGKNSWWWAERLSETYRVVIPIKVEFSASVGFIHKEHRGEWTRRIFFILAHSPHFKTCLNSLLLACFNHLHLQGLHVISLSLRLSFSVLLATHLVKRHFIYFVMSWTLTHNFKPNLLFRIIRSSICCKVHDMNVAGIAQSV